MIFDIDRERLKLVRRKSEEWGESQIKLQNLAEDTGGMFQAPEQPETLLKLAAQVANAVDSNYVITYIPTKPLTQGLESRKVSSHCNGVTIRARHRIVLNQVDSEENSVPAN